MLDRVPWQTSMTGSYPQLQEARWLCGVQ